ncbi:MAG: hypothetical protein R2810_04035 [Flavobacteriales bacterium]
MYSCSCRERGVRTTSRPSDGRLGGPADGLGRRVRSWNCPPPLQRPEEFRIGDLPAYSYIMQVLGKDGHVLKLARVVKQ